MGKAAPPAVQPNAVGDAGEVRQQGHGRRPVQHECRVESAPANAANECEVLPGVVATRRPQHAHRHDLVDMRVIRQGRRSVVADSEGDVGPGQSLSQGCRKPGGAQHVPQRQRLDDERRQPWVGGQRSPFGRFGPDSQPCQPAQRRDAGGARSGASAPVAAEGAMWTDSKAAHQAARRMLTSTRYSASMPDFSW